MKKQVFLFSIAMLLILLSGMVLAADRPDGSYAIFDGNGDYIGLPTSLRNNLNNDNFTIMFWFKPKASGSVFTEGDTFSSNGGDDNGIRFIFSSANGIYAHVRGSSGTVGQYASAYTNKNVWYQATLVRDYGSTVKLYVNGEEAWSGSDVAGPMTVTKGPWIGGEVGAGSDTVPVTAWFNGSMDEVMIYNKPLSADEINQTYQRGLEGRKSNISSNLVVYYDFENNDTTDNTQYNDKSSNNNDGTAYGGVHVAEHLGGFGVFDGSDDYIRLDNVFDTVPSKWTLELWLYTNSLPASDLIRVTGKRQVSGQETYMGAFQFDSSGNMHFFNMNNNNNYDVANFATISTGKWYYLVGVWDGTYYKAYLNGEFKGQTAGSAIPSDTYGHFDIGRRGWVGDSYLDGLIDEVRIYNDSLSAEEINQTYQRGLEGKKSNITSGLINYWSMDGDFTDGAGSDNGATYGGVLSTNFTYSPYSYGPEDELNVPGFDLYDSNGNLITSTTSEATLQIRDSSGSIKFVELNISGSFDLSGVSVENDSTKTVVSGLNSATGVIGTHSLYVPDTGGGVYVCNSATTLADVNSSCTGVVSFSCPGSSGSYSCTIENGRYKVSGLTGSGVGGSSPDVPEFSILTFVLAMLAGLLIVGFVRRRF